MCISSFIGDDYANRHPYKWPNPNDIIPSDNPFKSWLPTFPTKGLKPELTPAEIEAMKKETEALRKELEDLKILLKKANQFDAKHNEPHCEVEEKIETIKNHGDHLGVDFTEVFDSNTLPEEAGTPYEPFKVISPEGLVARFSTRQLAEKFVQYLSAYTGKDSVEFQIEEVSIFDLSVLNYGVFVNYKLVAAFVTLDNATKYIIELTNNMTYPYPDMVVKVI